MALMATLGDHWWRGGAPVTDARFDVRASEVKQEKRMWAQSVWPVKRGRVEDEEKAGVGCRGEAGVSNPVPV